MNFGYLLIVSSSKSANYLEMAYALALSIKNTQRPGYDKVALVIDNKSLVGLYNKGRAFDHVIEWKDQTFWNGRSWMDVLTPFEYTVCLDVDMLFTEDHSLIIDYFIENSELYVANRVYTYRNEIIVDTHYRKTFIENNLPNLYSMWTFFKKESCLVEEFFNLNRAIINNPEEFSNIFLSKYIPKILGTDEAFALSAKILAIEDEISYDLDFLKIVHMKPLIQNWTWAPSKWSNRVGFYLESPKDITIGNYKQTGIIHYVEKDLISREIIGTLEENLWKI